MVCTGGVGGMSSCGIISPRKTAEGEIFATLANPKAYTASRTHCIAKAPRFRRRKFSPPSFEDKIFPRNHPHPKLSAPLYSTASTLHQQWDRGPTVDGYVGGAKDGDGDGDVGVDACPDGEWE